MAAPKLTIHIENLENVINELRQRGKDVTRALEKITHAGAAVVLKEAIDRAPGSLGEELDAVTSKKTGTAVQVQVGPRHRGYIFRFVEFGTEAHEIPKMKKKRRKRKVLIVNDRFYTSVHHPGARKNPFMRPAYFASREKAQAAIAQATREALDA